jgi:hypothetical protein
LFGRDAARITALLFTLSPLVLRWSSHVMTDSLFLALSAGAMYFAVKCWMLSREEAAREKMDSALAWSTALAALATYTRYQGVLLLLPLALAAVAVMRAGCFPVRTLVAAILWFAPVEYILSRSGVHAGQFASRTAGAIVPTLAAYWNTLESFVLIAPYYFGYPVAALAIFGAMVAARGTSAVGPFAWMFAIWATSLLLLHAAFGSFQYRYMLPLLPGVLALAGHGAHQLYLAAVARRAYPIYSACMLFSLAYLALFSTAVMVFQRQTFADQKQAALYLRQHSAAADALFANERYGDFTQLGCVKLSFWSGRKVELMYDPESGRLRDLPVGSWVALGNEYGGNRAVEALAHELQAKYQLEPVQPAFTAQITPLMDDIMVDPLFNQNPTGWVLRYTPQLFNTHVLRITGRK